MIEYSSSKKQTFSRSYQLSFRQEPISKSPLPDLCLNTIGQLVNIKDINNINSKREEEEEV